MLRPPREDTVKTTTKCRGHPRRTRCGAPSDPRRSGRHVLRARLRRIAPSRGRPAATKHRNAGGRGTRLAAVTRRAAAPAHRCARGTQELPMRLLVVEEDRTVGSALYAGLTAHRFAVDRADSATAA